MTQKGLFHAAEVCFMQPHGGAGPRPKWDCGFGGLVGGRPWWEGMWADGVVLKCYFL
ncbi:MAG TPA: hypothetical protein ACFCUD_05235 [Cyclobacteriaceae bacterium]